MQYMGSKNRLSKELVPIIQSYITEDTKGYLEPMVGGANMIDKIECDNKIGCDVHPQLIALLQHVQERIDDLPNTIDEETYNTIKSNQKLYEDWYLGLVGFCCAYANIYFGGYARGNDNRDRPGEAIRNIKKQSYRLKDIKFECKDFKEIKDIKGYVIYCDPPYRGTAKYKTEEFPYEEFYNWCREMSKDNVVLISEYNMPDDFECIWQKETKVNFDSNRVSNDDKNNRVEKLYICK